MATSNFPGSQPAQQDQAGSQPLRPPGWAPGSPGYTPAWGTQQIPAAGPAPEIKPADFA